MRSVCSFCIIVNSSNMLLRFINNTYPDMKTAAKAKVKR